MVEYGAQATGPFDAPWPPGVVFPWAASLDCLGLANGNSIVSRPQVPLRATRVERRTREWSAVSSRAPLFAAGPVKWRQALADLFGAQGRNRTTDTVIFSHVLYQLSYLGDARDITGRLAKRRCYRGSAYPCPAGGATSRAGLIGAVAPRSASIGPCPG